MTRFLTALAAVASRSLVLARADAQTPLLDEVQTISAPGEPRPVERAFTTTAAGAIYQIAAIPEPAMATLVPMTFVLFLGGRRRRAASVPTRQARLPLRHW